MIVLHIVIITVLDSRREDKMLLLLPNTRTLPHFQRNFYIYLCCDFALHSAKSNIYLVFFDLTSRPTSLIAAIKLLCFLYGVYVISH
jgi:hypothetical protein